MNKLTITDKVFVPVSVNDELPIEQIKNKDVFALCDEHLFLATKIENGYELKDDNDYSFKEKTATHWLKEETNKYVLSKEEMEKLLNNVSDFGREYVEKTGKLWNHTEKAYQQHKKEYIKSIL